MSFENKFKKFWCRKLIEGQRSDSVGGTASAGTLHGAFVCSSEEGEVNMEESHHGIRQGALW